MELCSPHPSLRHADLPWLVATALFLALFGGCGSDAFKPVPVKGTVKFSDGSVPQGEVAIVRFDPVGGVADPAEKDPASTARRAAAGTIQPDGSFVLTTLIDKDGAIAGDYKVVLVVFKHHDRLDSAVPAKYAHPATTPLEATVSHGGSNEFSFTLDTQ